MRRPEDSADDDTEHGRPQRAMGRAMTWGVAATASTAVLAAGVLGWIAVHGASPSASEGTASAQADVVVEAIDASHTPQGASPPATEPAIPALRDAPSGILGVTTQESGHFLASPHGGAFATGNDDEDVWGGLSGTEIGEAAGVGGLGLRGNGRGGGGSGEGTIGLGTTGLIGHGGGGGTGQGFGGRGGHRVTRDSWREAAIAQRPESDSGDDYAAITEQQFIRVGDDAQSTFGIDVDTASYSNVRRFLEHGQLPPADAVRVEELINYFHYDLEPPTDGRPFALESEVADCPWDRTHKLVRVALAGEGFNHEDLPARNFVFLLDVSGSMQAPDRLPLLRESLSLLADRMRPQDRIAIVVYAGASGIVLDSTPGSQKGRVRAALQELEAGGSTNGGAGIELAYRLAQRHFIEGGSNRVILATDGDFNVGISNRGKLTRLIEKKRESGVFLSVLGVGRGNLKDATMESLADKGNGNYAYLDSLSEARKVLVEGGAANLVTIAKDVKIQVEFDATEVESWRLIGYENRKLAHADFADDRKDAGEIGAGHSVTALYEIVPKTGESVGSGSVMKVSVRYKRPNEETSALFSREVTADARSIAAASPDFRFAAAVAQFGMLLRDSDLRGEATWESTLTLARGATDDGDGCLREEFMQLVARAAELSSAPLRKPPARSRCELTARG